MKQTRSSAATQRRLRSVERYTDGWDIVVGKVMDRVSYLERRVGDLESELMRLRCEVEGGCDDDDLI